MGNDVPFSGLQYSGFTGSYYAPKAEPLCFKEPYYLLKITIDAAGQSFTVPTLTDYLMSCDAVMDYNGVYLVPTLDFDFPADSTLLVVSAYLEEDALLELLASPNPSSSVRTSEYYYIVDADGANQQLSNFRVFADYLNTQNFNLTLNGVLLTPLIDFSYVTDVLTIIAYMSVGDILGILPAAKLTRPSASVPAITFSVTQSGAFQNFADINIARYTRTSDAIVTLNGINLQPSVSPDVFDFSIANPTLSSPGKPDVLQLFITPYIELGSSITILCNTQSC